ncbi:kinase-like domain-containing protein [Rhizophagus diaphanus]|nr:kinase-like domain-containing protein [Rhizophagus diaphanus] [Rhizophagus sp. MUCL 43196]
MAPEVLRGKSYTPASDIYSFSMIMWELTSGIPPFSNRAHDLHLSLSICKDLMKKCWNEDPLKRPSSREVLIIIKNWIYVLNIMEFINAPIGHNKLATKFHPKACFTSRLLDFTSKKLNEILESENLNNYSQASVKVNEMLVSEDLDDYIIKDLKSLGMQM